MYYEKRYIQFNDLVFDGYDMISESDESIQYKGSSTAYSYGHGSYRANKGEYLFISEGQVSMTISLKTKKLPCADRVSYVRFAEQELSKPGKLWAVKNNELIWANAVPNNVRSVKNGKRYEKVYDVEFIIPSGVWYKADKQRTFLLPYDVCSLMACKGFEEYNPCASSKGGGDCCEACEDNRIAEVQREVCGCCCDSSVTADMALCYHQDELQAFYGCDTPYQVKYDCEAAERFNTNPAFGQRFCVADVCDEPIISGRYYSDTDLPTDEVNITLIGDMTNPWITINGNTNIIEGEYNGELTITASGDVYYRESDCCEPELIDTSVWQIPEGNNYGWMIYPQLNSIIIHTNNCCSTSGMACAYIDAVNITS